jgi:hypothetical protein
VKSTATSGVKETLKPDAYKQWEQELQVRLERLVTAYLLYNGSAS